MRPDSSAVAYVVLAVVLVVAPACRKVSQPALDGASGPQSLFPVEQNGDWGYVTRSGTVVIAPRFDRAYRFVNGRALVRADDRYGFIDTSGTVVIPPTFDRAWHFSDGMAPVRPDSLWGFVDRSGTVVIEPRFDQIAGMGARDRPHPLDEMARSTRPGPLFVPSASTPPPYFSEGRVRVRLNDQWGYVDRQGQMQIAPRFMRAWAFQNGLARVQFPNEDMGYVTPGGTVVWPPSQR